MVTQGVTIQGTSALLMHRYPMVPIEGFEKLTPEAQAEHAAYRMPGGNLYLPGIAVQRALVAGAAYSKGKGRATLAKIAAACLMVEPEYIDLGVAEYALDSRPVVMPATKGRIMRHRPRLDTWEASFDLTWDETLIATAQVSRILTDTGQRVGLLDFRPERKGPFGRFIVTRFE